LGAGVTPWDVLSAMRRRWYVVLSGAVATMLAALWVTSLPGVYHAQLDVVFMWPQGHQHANTFQYGSQSLIDTAGVVGAIVGGSASGAQPVSDTVTLVGEGITHGYSVRLPNAGGQWAINFTSPVLDVQASGSSPAEVQRTLATVVARINTVLHEQQADEGVPAELMIRTRLSPPTPQVLYGKGSRVRAIAATFLIGCGITAAAALATDRRLRTRHRAAPSAANAPEPG
jgi:hypothetical protein